MMTLNFEPQNREVINNLSNIVRKFYPVGFPHENELFNGFKELKELLTQKIESAQDFYSGTKWNEVRASLEKEGLTFKDLSYFQSPDYRVEVLVSSEKKGEVELSTHCVLAKSILSEIHTLFFEHRMVHTRLKGNSRLLFGEEQASKQELAIATVLRKAFDQVYPDSQDVNFKLLFMREVSGVCPMGEDIELLKPSYSLYRILFDDDYRNAQIV